jgi:exodeoxyribonuclease VII large subunit
MLIYTVSEISSYVKSLLDQDELLGDVWVSGEVSNCRPAASGHWYWTLKDGDAQLSCVMWKGQAVRQASLPEDGQAFQLHGQISVYPQGGRYQMYVDHVEPVGVGDLYRQFEALKAQLETEGLFDPGRKRPLPAWPRAIGVVTSAQAAALRDICKVLGRRWPLAEVRVAPALVQGEAAPDAIVAALAAIGRANVDVVLVARGGGSIEDLWAFNSEAVARAIAACPVPVISGVGHETDFTIADFVADVRAATPSVAAEMATPNAEELKQLVDDHAERLRRSAQSRLVIAAEELRRIGSRLLLASPMRPVTRQAEAVRQLRQRLARAAASQLRLAGADVAGLDRRLAALSPLATFARGYAHVQRRPDGATVRHVADIRPGVGLTVRVADGSFDAVVPGQATLFDLEQTR